MCIAKRPFTSMSVLSTAGLLCSGLRRPSLLLSLLFPYTYILKINLDWRSSLENTDEWKHEYFCLKRENKEFAKQTIWVYNSSIKASANKYLYSLYGCCHLVASPENQYFKLFSCITIYSMLTVPWPPKFQNWAKVAHRRTRQRPSQDAFLVHIWCS